MDIVWMIVAMVIFYLVPELFRRRRQTEYKYPEIPDSVPPPSSAPPAPVQAKKADIPFVVENIKNSAPASAGTASFVSPVIAAEDTVAWQGGFDAEAARAGVIYAEVIGPPKALRHLPRGRR